MARIDMATKEITRPTTTPSTRPAVKTEKPKLYKVILINDDFTRFEIVMLVLKGVFKLGAERATHVMMTAHQKGSCLIAAYTLEIAETKVEEARAIAQKRGAALAFAIEPDA